VDRIERPGSPSMSYGRRMSVPGVVVVAVAACAGCRANFEQIAGDDAATDAAPMDTLPTTDRRWMQRDVPGPGRLSGARAAFHRVRRTVVLYGGDHTAAFPSLDPSAAMWEYDGVAWTRLCDPCAPGPRFAPAMAYDTARDRIVLFGGHDLNNALGTLYEWDGSTWTLVTPPGSQPPPRGLAPMAYDERRKRIVMFGGGSLPQDQNADVFEYDGTVWSKPTITGPGPMLLVGQGATAAWNPVTERIDVLEDGGSGRDSAWSWDGVSWVRLCTTCTGIARRAAAIAIDPSPARTYVIGGYDDAIGSEIAGTWQIDASGTRLLSPLPDQRDSVALAYDGKRDVFVLYGGNGRACGGNCNETWELVRPVLP
jgi:hypothetical protein